MDVTAFRAAYPEFGSASAYPDPMVTFWLGIAANQINADRWAALTDLGLGLFTAHQLVLERQATKSAANGAVPGLSQGVLSAKAIDKVSVSYDVASAVLEGGGDLNLTTYGSRLYRLMQMMGAGGLQVC